MGTGNIKSLLIYFSENIKNALKPYENCENICEIRLRAGRTPSIKLDFEEIALKGCIVSREDIEYSFKAVCEYSVYSFARELSEGYITIKGGHRVGLCGTAVTALNEIESIKYISGMNFRIASERVGTADRLVSDIFSKEKCGIIISGPPSCGKTTVLRDLCRQIGNKYRVSLIDERGEIAAVYKGTPQNDIGAFTDVFDGYPKASGIITAIRTMTPDFIFVDEIGSESDYKAIEQSVYCGAEIIATMHIADKDMMLKRKNIKALLDTGAFRYIVFLGSGKNTGKIISVTGVSECLN